MPKLTVVVEAGKDILALIRRARPSRTEGVIEIGDLRVDPLARAATLKGNPLILAPMEFELLEFLVCNPDRVISREELLRKVWGYDYVGTTHTLAVHIGWLRVKLGDPGRLVQTIVGVGYRLVVPTGRAAPRPPASGR